ncbi:post-GPI attachment to proteins factor 3-like isoform X1 [Montipora foliosa]|uniref:post-GPI attachment to proteins factor 3-like isoform X1 n=1 Tax=Montipora foliosa TaxID=591990 RepID=UPI0035F1CECD
MYITVSWRRLILNLQSIISVTIILLWNPARGSSGDKSYPFRTCLKECKRGCHLDEYPGKLPLYLTIFWWDCTDECKYQCMHSVTATDLKKSKKVQQFYGKWPFVRFLGIQEPASVLFSIFNAAGHILGWRMLRSRVPSTNYDMYLVWKIGVVIDVNAWLWSMVFHTRDLNWTEKMDYFAATSLVVYQLFTCLMRIIGLQNKSSCFCVGFFLLCLFSGHVFYLAFVKFDYGYNMKFNITMGIMNMCSWLGWCYKSYPQQPYVWKAAFISVSVFLLLSLELGEFPPILWIFDAHSLWHLGTAPLSYFWYSFLVDDARQQLAAKQILKKSS